MVKGGSRLWPQKGIDKFPALGCLRDSEKIKTPFRMFPVCFSVTSLTLRKAHRLRLDLP